MGVVENYRNIEERVKRAAIRSGRKPEDVTIIAVCKTKPNYMTEELAEIGVLDFGENKPQELKRKCDEIIPADKQLRWHMIGNIQTNKVKMFVGRAALIHSVPDMHIARAISEQAVKENITAHILIEVNLAGEESKHGLDIDAGGYNKLEGLVREMSQLPGIVVDGLMQIAPPVDDPEDNRQYFRCMRLLRDKLHELNIQNAPMTQLSMGMTGDFEVAIEEGATYVRIGTAIFGERLSRIPNKT